MNPLLSASHGSADMALTDRGRLQTRSGLPARAGRLPDLFLRAAGHCSIWPCVVSGVL